MASKWLKKIEEEHSDCCGWPEKGDDCDVVTLARALDIAVLAFRLLNAYGDAEESERTLREVANG